MALLDREKWLRYLEFPSVMQRPFFFNPFQKLSESKRHEQTMQGIRQALLVHCKAETKHPIDEYSSVFKDYNYYQAQ